MLRRLSTALVLMLRYGPRPVLLAREAKLRGAVQKKDELRPLISLLRERKLRTVVELGTYRGGTLWLWCQIAEPDARIVSIDLPGGEFGGGYDAAVAERFESFARPGQELVLVRADSHSQSTHDRVVEKLGGRPVDFLFIDADHTYEGVKQDFEMYSPLVAKGGVVAFHDILPHDREERCQVDVFWEELKHATPHVVKEFTDTSSSDHVWGGIGAVLVD